MGQQRTEYIAPTQSLLCKWLREVHAIGIFPVWGYNDDPKWSVIVHFLDERCDDDDRIKILDAFDTYEEALESGLVGGLKMIE